MEPYTGQRNRLNILGWGLESDPFVPITASLSGGSGVEPDPGTIAMFALGGVALIALRRHRKA